MLSIQPNKLTPPGKPPFVLLRPFVAFWNWLVPPSVAHADRQTRTARVVAVILMLVFCIGLVVAAAMNGRSMVRAFKHWRSNSLAKDALRYEKQADDYLDANKGMEYQDTLVRAFRLATDAYSKDPDNPEAIRVAARIYTRAGASESRWLWDKLNSLNATTDDDLVWRIQALAALREDKLAADQIEQLLRDRPASAKIVELADTVMLKIGRAQQLIAILRNYLKQKPDNPDTRLLLGMRLAEHGDDQEKREGQDMIWELAMTDDQTGVRALDFLDKISLSPEAARRLIARLQQHPLSREPQRIAALRREAMLDPLRKEEILKAAVESHRSMKREDLVPLARWLYEERDAVKLLDLLKVEEVRDYPPLLHEYFNALSMLGRYDELERLVKDSRTRFTNAERDFHLVHLAFVKSAVSKSPLGDDVDRLIVTAVNSALRESQMQMLVELGNYAGQRRRFRTAMEAFKAASASPSTERVAYEGMLKASYGMGSMKDFSYISRETVRRWPNNQYFLEQYLYACLLSGDAMEISTERASKMLEARPNDTQRKLLMALASHRYGDATSCAHHLQNSNLQDLTPGQSAVFCGLALSAGFTSEAHKLAAAISDDIPMLPEEEKFLQMVKLAPESPKAY